MRKAHILIASLVLLGGYSGANTAECPAPGSAVQPSSRQEPTSEEIIRKFTEKETEFYNAWMQYTYTQIATIRVLAVNGVAPRHREEMRIVSEVVFKDDGSREVRIIRDSGQLRSVGYTKEDAEVINNINPFALTEEQLPLYDLRYRGKEKVDELVCYVFSVKPKKVEKDHLYFEGRIWVDDVDLQVVRTVGKPVPESRDNKFPEFETIRQIIDKKYWFPVWTHADDYLYFPDQRVRIEETITYENYKKFGSDVNIEFEGTTDQK